MKRTSRDIEIETEEDVFLTLSSNVGPVGSGSCGDSSGSYSASLSTSDKSDLSADNIEEVFRTSEKPFEGKPDEPVCILPAH